MANGANSGFMPVTTAATPMVWNYTVENATSPLWFYCAQTGHCGKGMVFSVNPVQDSPRNFSAFVSLAEIANGTNATSGSSSPVASGSASASGSAPTQGSSGASGASLQWKPEEQLTAEGFAAYKTHIVWAFASFGLPPPRAFKEHVPNPEALANAEIPGLQ